MRSAAWLVAVFTIVVGIVGLISPFATLDALGGVMCLQAVVATLLGPGRARAVLEWETMQGTAALSVLPHAS